MNALTIPGGAAATMSSREIAELTGKEISNVHRDIRSMLIELYGEEHVARIVPEQYRNRHSEFIRENADAILSAITGDDSKRNHQDQRGFSWERDTRGYITAFKLDHTHTMTLVSGYNVKLRKAIIDRWHDLEEQARNPIAALSRIELLKLALDSEEQRAALEHKVEELEPKAKALDRIADADGTMNPTVAAKALQIQPKRLFDWMREKHWIYRRPGGSGNVAYQDKIQVGYLTHKVTTVQREDGTDKVCEQVLVTAKGLAKLSQAFDTGTH